MKATLLTLDSRDMPAATGSRLYRDYIAGADGALQFYSFGPLEFGAALARRQAHCYPRQAVSQQLADYNTRLGAEAQALANACALGDPDTFCVITGQQAGFMGGPAYTAYKIITTIRLAEHLSGLWDKRVVPVFWLASEDHDFGEINHTYLIKPDGEVGRVRFAWRAQGRPVSDLPVTEAVQGAFDEYWSLAAPGPFAGQSREMFSWRADEKFSEWQARVWSRFFSSRGLVIVEPQIIRGAVPGFFVHALDQVSQIRQELEDVTRRLTGAGYAAAITSEDAGFLYTFGEHGQRVRVREPKAHVRNASRNPVRYSTDAALRPLLADAALPVVASVLGPGETAYQGMLKPLYELFALPQPVLYPRLSFSVVAANEAERLRAYGTSVEEMLTDQVDFAGILSGLLPDRERAIFRRARDGVEDALSPLRAYVADVDPSLEITWRQTIYRALQTLEKLEQRATRARTGQLGFSKLELRRIRNAVLPRSRLQERVLPFSHFYARYGPGLVDILLSAGELEDLRHHVLILEEASV